jgi:hypothetical protein
VTRRTALHATAIALVLLFAGGSLAQRKPIVVQAAKFTTIPRGWRVSDDDFGFLTRRGAGVGSLALSYRPSPRGWAVDMPRDGIAVSVLLIRRSSDPRANLCGRVPHWPDSPEIRRLPLRLPKTTGHRLEGDSRVLEFRVAGRMDESYNVDLRVDVNRVHPTAAMLARAQAVVSGLRFPSWPKLKRC